MKRWMLPCVSALVLISLACGGGGSGPNPSPVNANRLVYTNPTDSSSWRLVRNSSSSDTTLLLDLLAPTGGYGRGVTVVLTADPSLVSWKPVDGTSFIRNGGYAGDLIQKTSLKGGTLGVLLSQKPGVPASYGVLPVLSVALELKPGARPGAIQFTATQGSHLGVSATPEAMTIALGTLSVE